MSRGSFVSIRIVPVEPPFTTWTPVRVYFRRGAAGWDLVGVDRTGNDRVRGRRRDDQRPCLSPVSGSGKPGCV